MSIELDRSRGEIAHAGAYPSRDRARGQALVTLLQTEQPFQVDLLRQMIISVYQSEDECHHFRGGSPWT